MAHFPPGHNFYWSGSRLIRRDGQRPKSTCVTHMHSIQRRFHRKNWTAKTPDRLFFQKLGIIIMRGFARKIKTVVKRVLMRHDNRSAAHSLPPSSVVLQGFDNSLNLSNCQEASIGSVTRSATECFTEVNVTTSHGYMNVAGQGYVASQGNGANITCQGSDTG